MSPVTALRSAVVSSAVCKPPSVTVVALRPEPVHRVLIIDDDPFVRETARAQLGGPELGVSAIAQDEVSALAGGRPTDLVILGSIRVESGELSSGLRSLFRAPVVPLIRPSIYVRPRQGAADRIAPLLAALADCRLRIGQHLLARALPCEFVVRWGEYTVRLEAGGFALRGQDLGLTRVESSILSLLMRHCGEIVSAGLIEDAVFRSKPRTGSNFIPVHMSRIRAKLKAARSDIFIENVRGEGYVLFWSRSFSPAEMPAPELLGSVLRIQS